MPEPAKSSVPQGTLPPQRSKSAVWPRLIELWLASILFTFFVVRILGSRLVQQALNGIAHRHLP